MYKSHLVDDLFKEYAILSIWLVFGLSILILLLYILSTGFDLKLAFQRLKSVFPAALVTATSGSGIIAMPVTMKIVSEHLKDSRIVKAVVPATINILQISDCMVNVFLCYMIYKCFYGHPPTIEMLWPFTLVFGLLRFASAAIVGSTVFILLPIYESYLHFNPTMLSLIVAFNILFDPIIGGGNTFTGVASYKIFEGIWTKLFKQN